MLFFDRKPPAERLWIQQPWIYDLRTNQGTRGSATNPATLCDRPWDSHSAHCCRSVRRWQHLQAVGGRTYLIIMRGRPDLPQHGRSQPDRHQTRKSRR